MIYHKSVAEVRKGSAELRERMKPENYEHIESKVQVHFKKRVDETPECLKAENLKYLDNEKSVELPIKKKIPERKTLDMLSPVRSQKA